MSHCKGPHPTIPGFYWARVHASWEPVEYRADGYVYGIGKQYPIMPVEDIYGNVEAWGPKIEPLKSLQLPTEVAEVGLANYLHRIGDKIECGRMVDHETAWALKAIARAFAAAKRYLCALAVPEHLAFCASQARPQAYRLRLSPYMPNGDLDRRVDLACACGHRKQKWLFRGDWCEGPYRAK